MKKQANERTFQGVLLNVISEIITENPELEFSQVTQEENIGIAKKQRFADALLYSAIDSRKKILIELKNANWEATDDELVDAAAYKAISNGYDFFVTGTPRQFAIYKTFESGKTTQERRIAIFNISKIRKDDEVKTEKFKSTIKFALKGFLKNLSDLVHGVREIVYDSINNLYINRFSAFISDATGSMWDIMIEKITSDVIFKKRLKDYLENQDIFNLTQSFDDEDIFKLCQLANYMLYLKILFYSDIQRNVPALKLKPLIIPDDINVLNSSLQQRFADVLEYDYELIFTPSVIDEFEFQKTYLPELQRNVETVKNLNYDDLNADIIGSIYNNLIDNQEQHDRGQHFTNTNEVDIINGFCINEKTKFAIDTSCGAGTFLVRAYYFFKYYHPNLTHEQLLEKVWGVEIATFPAFLSVMNLCLLNIKSSDNYPLIIRSDFVKIKTNYSYSGYFLNANKEFEITKLDNRQKKVKLPMYDACIGNPPYIRQEYIENKEEWYNLVKVEHGIKKLNQQSDFYVFYLMHTVSFLKEGGRLGYVISSSWLDVSFGKDLQKFMLDHFKIVAIIDNQVKRSFETASINSVILILEKCSNTKDRAENQVKFIRFFKDYEEMIGNTWKEDRIEKVNHFVQTIENAKKNAENKNQHLFIIKQKDLENDSTVENKYENGHWGAKYLRSPSIYEKIIGKAANKLIKAADVVDIKFGIKTGANGFFYVEDHTDDLKKLSDEEYIIKLGVSRDKHAKYWERMGWFYSDLTKQHHEIERSYVKPIFKSQREADKLDVNINMLRYYVVMCPVAKKTLEKNKTKILKYINEAENRNIHNNPSVKNRDFWYDLTSYTKNGDFIFPSMFGEKFYTIDNRNSKVFCDCVNNDLFIKKEYSNYGNEIFLLLNSILFRFFIDLYGRQLTGALTISDVDVVVLKKLPILNPELLKPYKTELESIYTSMKSREQGTIFEEIKQTDRRKLDEIIFEVLGLEKSDVDELYKVVCEYISNRKQKSESVTNTKQKQKFTFEEAVIFIKERFPEIRSYESLIQSKETKPYLIPAWKAKYPKTSNGNGNIFKHYQVYFVEGNVQRTVDFENENQVELFKFLNTEFDIKDCSIDIPVNENACKILLESLKHDFEKYSSQIASILKKHRITSSYKMVYKEILFSIFRP